MNLGAWLNQTINVATVASTDSFGKPTYNAPAPVKARVESSRTIVRRSNGEEAVANTVVYTTTPINLTDRIWLPGASTASADASNVPLMVDGSSDKFNARSLFKVTL